MLSERKHEEPKANRCHSSIVLPESNWNGCERKAFLSLFLFVVAVVVVLQCFRFYYLFLCSFMHAVHLTRLLHCLFIIISHNFVHIPYFVMSNESLSFGFIPLSRFSFLSFLLANRHLVYFVDCFDRKKKKNSPRDETVRTDEGRLIEVEKK